MGFTALDSKGRKILYDIKGTIKEELYCPCCKKKMDFVIKGRDDRCFMHSDERIKECPLAKLDGYEGEKLRQAASVLIKKLNSKKDFMISLPDKIYTFPSERKVEIEECIKCNDKERFCTAKVIIQAKNLQAVFELIPEDADDNFVNAAFEFYKNTPYNAFLIRPSGLESSIVKVRKGEYVLNPIENLVKTTNPYDGFVTLSEIAKSILKKENTIEEIKIKTEFETELNGIRNERNETGQSEKTEKEGNESCEEKTIDEESLKIDNLQIDGRIKRLLNEEGITKLYPPQFEALKHALEGKNIVLAIPTASGKSLVAYLAILKSVLNGGKALYIVPLRALASEKLDDLTRYADALGIKVGCSVGDYDSPDPSLERFDIIVATSERADSLLRHRSGFIDNLTVVVADEIHLINDASRGHILEVILARLKQLNKKIQFIALSATISNSKELSAWLDASHIYSTWRPVVLKEGVCCTDTITFKDGTKRKVDFVHDATISLVLDTVKEGAQALVFVSRRKSSESLAKSLASKINKHLSEEEKKILQEVKNRLIAAHSERTSMCDLLGKCIENGTAFHNAGLTNEQRKIVENAFKERKLKCIVATPTLAAGVNLPARRVIVRDLHRFDSNEGSSLIPVLEVKQMLGRAGRPKYDKEGEAILIARDESYAEEITRKYILGKSEKIVSKLGTEPALRVHILASVATGYASTYEEILKFIGHTFFAHQQKNTGNLPGLEYVISNVISFLIKYNLIASSDDIFSEKIDDFQNPEKLNQRLLKIKLRPTLFGLRVSQLYIDPLSGVRLKEALEYPIKNKVEITPFSFLHAICTTPDMGKTIMYLKKNDYEPIMQIAQRHQDEILRKIPKKYDYEYEYYLSEIKTASLFESWITETSEDSIVNLFDIGPGDIHTKIEYAEWLLYSMKELAKMFNPSLVEPLGKTIDRVKYGIREELL
ncbi:MAG: DEAD/DEAH box helicase, partial [Thermoplasmata archaeon]